MSTGAFAVDEEAENARTGSFFVRDARVPSSRFLRVRQMSFGTSPMRCDDDRGELDERRSNWRKNAAMETNVQCPMYK